MIHGFMFRMKGTLTLTGTAPDRSVFLVGVTVNKQ
jgi:hypothetical protein